MRRIPRHGLAAIALAGSLSCSQNHRADHVGSVVSHGAPENPIAEDPAVPGNTATAAATATPAPETSAPLAARPHNPNQARVSDGTPRDACTVDSDCSLYAPPFLGCPMTSPCSFAVTTKKEIARYEADHRALVEKCKDPKVAAASMDCGEQGSFRCLCSPPPAVRITCDQGTCRQRER